MRASILITTRDMLQQQLFFLDQDSGQCSDLWMRSTWSCVLLLTLSIGHAAAACLRVYTATLINMHMEQSSTPWQTGMMKQKHLLPHTCQKVKKTLKDGKQHKSLEGLLSVCLYH
jgi:hypothetical protein